MGIDGLDLCVCCRNLLGVLCEPKSLGLSVSIDVDLIFMSVIQVDLISAWGIGIDSFFSVEIGIDLSDALPALSVWIQS